MRQLKIDAELKPAEMIHTLRKDADITMQYLAYKSGLSLAAISKYESGKRVPRLDSFIALMNALDADILIATKRA